VGCGLQNRLMQVTAQAGASDQGERGVGRHLWSTHSLSDKAFAGRAGTQPMNDNSLKHTISAKIEQALTDLKQLETSDDLERLIRVRHLLTVEMAAEIRECSTEWMRRLCEKTHAKGQPIAVKIGRDWIIVTNRLLDLVERTEGRHARLVVEDKKNSI
jgi:hypothetical protein